MKNISLAINFVLLAAVGYLYYYNFSGKKNVRTSIKTKDTTANNAVVIPQYNIAYIELDSLNEHITFIKEKRKQLETEQKIIEAEWQKGYKNLEAQKNNFLKKGAAITQEEARQFQAALIQQQQAIDEKKQLLNQKLSEKSFGFMDDIQKKLKEFLMEYNREKRYTYILTSGSGLDYMVYKDSSLNITGDVIKGMNEKMKAAIK